MSALPDPDYAEPVIVMTVRSLLVDMREDFNKRFDELAGKLDDRVTIGVFRALRSDLDAALIRLSDVERELSTTTARSKGIAWTVGKVGAVAYAVTMTALAIWGLTHG